MQSWKYISIIALVLLGGVSYFGYWAFSQHKVALKAYDASYSQLSASLAVHAKLLTDRTVSAHTNALDTATTSSSISLVFPLKGDEFYAGCSYEIAWETSTTTSSSTSTISALSAQLINTETQEALGPIASGVSKEYELEPDTQSIDWRVGAVLPGEYFLLMADIDSPEEEIKSEYFTIRHFPEDVSTSEQENICKESGGFF